MQIGSQWTRENLAWAAGLFDGEGCINKTRNGFQLVLGMTDEDVVRRFSGVIGCGSVRGPLKRPGYKPVWIWTLSTTGRCEAVLAALWHWLGARRRARFAEVMKAWLSLPMAGKYKRECLRGHPYTPENTYLTPNGRSCRACRNTHSASYKKKKRYGSSQLHGSEERLSGMAR